jgi:hypothetical protein
MQCCYHQNMVSLIVCLSTWDIQDNLWILWSRNIVLLTVRFLDVAKFTTLTPLSLLFFRKLSFPIIPTISKCELKHYFMPKILWQERKSSFLQSSFLLLKRISYCGAVFTSSQFMYVANFAIWKYLYKISFYRLVRFTSNICYTENSFL